MPTQFIFRTQVILSSTTTVRLLRYYLLLHTLACKHDGVPYTSDQAHKQALQIFNRSFTSDTGKPFMICTRCDRIDA